MKIVIIDNNTDQLNSLLHVAKQKQATVTIIKADNLSSLQDNDFDLAILSGGYWYDDPSLFSKKYQREIEFIQNTTMPVLGICLGMQLIALAYGGKIMPLKAEYHGFREIKVDRNLIDSDILRDSQLYFENHTVGVVSVPTAFDVLATSEECIEIIHHQTKPLVGVQFHPEKLNKHEHSAEVWGALFNLLGIR